ncbi:MAG: hypothetical protein OXF31_06925 [Gammaproteobacteria bacterium]|nr:hypothetical protein [Gammaproteobacteria bacterium]
MTFSSSTAVRRQLEFEPRHSVISQDKDDYIERRVKVNISGAFDLNKAHQSLPDIEEILARFPKLTSEENREFRKRTLTPSAEWEGYVESIRGSEFFVKMTNVQSKSPLPTDQAFFSIDDVSTRERHLLKEGAIVRWVIGRERLPSGQIRKVSELYFRQLPAHSKADFNRALKKAKTLVENINWDEASRSE